VTTCCFDCLQLAGCLMYRAHSQLSHKWSAFLMVTTERGGSPTQGYIGHCQSEVLCRRSHCLTSSVRVLSKILITHSLLLLFALVWGLQRPDGLPVSQQTVSDHCRNNAHYILVSLNCRCVFNLYTECGNRKLFVVQEARHLYFV